MPTSTIQVQGRGAPNPSTLRNLLISAARPHAREKSRLHPTVSKPLKGSELWHCEEILTSQALEPKAAVTASFQPLPPAATVPEARLTTGSEHVVLLEWFEGTLWPGSRYAGLCRTLIPQPLHLHQRSTRVLLCRVYVRVACLLTPHGLSEGQGDPEP